MDDITNKYEFQRILQEAAQYRVLRRVFESLPADERDRKADLDEGPQSSFVPRIAPAR
jgi:hypothetical protein